MRLILILFLFTRCLLGQESPAYLITENECVFDSTSGYYISKKNNLKCDGYFLEKIKLLSLLPSGDSLKIHESTTLLYYKKGLEVCRYAFSPNNEQFSMHCIESAPFINGELGDKQDFSLKDSIFYFSNRGKKLGFTPLTNGKVDGTEIKLDSKSEIETYINYSNNLKDGVSFSISNENSNKTLYTLSTFYKNKPEGLFSTFTFSKRCSNVGIYVINNKNSDTAESSIRFEYYSSGKISKIYYDLFFLNQIIIVDYDIDGNILKIRNETN